MHETPVPTLLSLRELLVDTCRLLRARRERPDHCRAADERDEFPLPHAAYPKAKDHELIIAPCIAEKRGHSCPRWVKSGHRAVTWHMSALPPKADISRLLIDHLVGAGGEQLYLLRCRHTP